MKCRICGSSVKIIDAVEKHIYYHCDNCDLIFMDSAFYVTSEEEKIRYTKHNNTIENEGYVNMFLKFINKAVKPYIKEGSALDFGCGPGPVLSALLNKDDFVTDVYDPYFYPEKIYLNKSYDLITCTEVIEHISEPLKTFDFFYKYLKIGGILTFMTLFHSGVESFENWWYKNDSTHICFYSLKTFKYLETHTNFKIIFKDDKNTITMKKEK